MNQQESRISKEDIEMIYSGLNEYVNYVNYYENQNEYQDIQNMINDLSSYLKK